LIDEKKPEVKNLMIQYCLFNDFFVLYLNFLKVDLRSTVQYIGVEVAEYEIVIDLRIFGTFLSCRSESASMKWLFPAEPHSSGGFIVPELVIPSGKTFFQRIPHHFLFVCYEKIPYLFCFWR
jgi:hypothetical protein